jgi:hypothetical protein
MIRQIKYCWCGTIAEGNTEQCATHNAEDRKAERQANKVKVVASPNKVSPKRAGQVAEYVKLKREYMALYPVCEVPECNLRSVEIHHQRGKEGERLTDINYFMAVCRPHHDEFTEHSKQAIKDGHSVSRTAKP